MGSFIDFMMDDATASSQNDKLKESLKNRSGGSNKIFYRYKDMNYGQSATVRFLPASAEIAENEVQPRFWMPKKVIRLRFENPEQENSEVILRIPAMQMYTGCKTEHDPVLKQAKALFDEAERLEKSGKSEESKQVRAKGSYHWHRGETIAQGFVVRSPFTEQDLPENPIRLFELTKQVMNVINNTLNSDDPDVNLEYWPCHGKHGSNFVIKKNQSGEWPKYDAGSCFSRTSSAWTTAQIEALNTFGLFTLENFLPQQPGETEYAVLAEIVRLSIQGERVWNPDWEDHLETVKVYKTGQNQSDRSTSTDADTLQSQVRETMSKLTGTGSTSTSEILTSLSAGGRKVNDPPANGVAEVSVHESAHATDGDESNDAEPEPQTVTPPTKSADQVRSVVERIKGRTSGKTAAAAD